MILLCVNCRFFSLSLYTHANTVVLIANFAIEYILMMETKSVV